MKKRVYGVVVLMVALIFSGLQSSIVAQPTERDSAERVRTHMTKPLPGTSRVIVVFRSEEKRNRALNSAGTMQGFGLHPNVTGQVNKQFRNVAAVSMTVPTHAIAGMKANPDVLVVEPDGVVQVNAQISGWGIDKIGAPKSWVSGYTGKNVKIAVIDTGIAPHPDLVIAGGVSVVPYTSSYHDDSGHGTHVAGIIGARNNNLGIVGVAPESSIYAVKVLDSKGAGYWSDVIAGIDWAITQRMDIINLSLGTGGDLWLLQEAVKRAEAQGILVVASAGNSGNSSGTGDTVAIPARYPAAIAVAAIDVNQARAPFSSTGPAVEVAAPGVDIQSTYLNNMYMYLSGTSMAAPYVAGTLALLKQAYPTFSHRELRAQLQVMAQDLGVQGRDAHFGFGMVKTPVQNKTVTSVTTSQKTYTLGQTVVVQVKTTDQNGRALSGASVLVQVIPPRGITLSRSGSTNTSGLATFSFPTSRNSLKAVYTVQAFSALNLYGSSQASTTFTLR